METFDNETIRQNVRKTYGAIAKGEEANGNSGCGCGCGESTGTDVSCCTGATTTNQSISETIGYSPEDLSFVPKGSNMGLGCGNPQLIANLKQGETVLDLGSGGGFDCFLAAKAVGETGLVIGVDMTAEMVNKARRNKVKMGVTNVEFRLGEIEHLPVMDDSVDVIISNCVINLSPEKKAVFQEAFRVLKTGGRLAISDIVATAELPEEAKKDLELHAQCVAGAAPIQELRSTLEMVGFSKVQITPNSTSREILEQWQPGGNIADYVLSATIEAIKE